MFVLDYFVKKVVINSLTFPLYGIMSNDWVAYLAILFLVTENCIKSE